MRICVLVLAAAMLTAAPAFAQTDPAATTTPAATEPTEPAPAATAPTTEAPATEVTQTSNEPRRICRTIQRTESRLRTRRERICATEAEWDQMGRDGAALTENMRGPPPGN